jgi:hypothetical protein
MITPLGYPDFKFPRVAEQHGGNGGEGVQGQSVFIVLQSVSGQFESEIKGVYLKEYQAYAHLSQLERARCGDSTVLNSVKQVTIGTDIH